MDALEGVRQEFQQERDQLIRDLEEQISELMGDRPINLNSPEQLSWVIYSKKPHDKKVWADLFDSYRMSDTDYRSTVRRILRRCTNKKQSSAQHAMALVRYGR